MGNSRTPIGFRVIGKLFVSVLPVTTCIHSFMKSIHPAERELFSQDSPPVPKLYAKKSSIAAEKDKLETRQDVTKGSTLLVTPIRCDPKYITAAEQVVLRVLWDTTVLVSTQA